MYGKYLVVGCLHPFSIFNPNLLFKYGKGGLVAMKKRVYILKLLRSIVAILLALTILVIAIKKDI